MNDELLNLLDDISALTITLNRVLAQNNLKQGYAVARTLSIKLSTLMEKISFELVKNDEL